MKTLLLTKTLGFSVSFIFLSLLVWSISISYGAEKDDLKRFNSEGPVEVEAVFLNPLLMEPGSIVQFELNISTHTENLDTFPPDKHAYLQIGNGMLHKSIGWIDQKSDSHHIEGILKFIGPIPESSNQIQLFLHDLGGVNKREFTWKLPISRKQTFNP